MADFFISFNRTDSAWAEWIAWQLEEAGFTVTFQLWDFQPGRNFVAEMDKATKEGDRTIAVLSSNYLRSGFGSAEWMAAFRQDPIGEKGKLIPIRVEELELEGLLAEVIYIDLVGLDETLAADRLQAGVAQRRAKPPQRPRYPGASAKDKPEYPGSTPSVKARENRTPEAAVVEAAPRGRPGRRTMARPSRLFVMLSVIMILITLGTFSFIDRLSRENGDNSTILHTYFRMKSENYGVIVLVDIVSSQTQNPWASSWPQLIDTDPVFVGHNIYSYRMSAKLLASVGIDELTENTKLAFERDQVLNHRKIVYLCHGLGGLIVTNLLHKYPEYRARVALMYFFSTPTTGSEISKVASLFDDLQASSIFRENSLLLENQLPSWRADKFDILSHCAYGTGPRRARIISMSSSSGLCDTVRPIDADFFGIFSPASSVDVPYLAFRNAFLETIVSTTVVSPDR